MSEELTEKEKRFLSMLFTIGNSIIEHTRKDDESILYFDSNDLYNLSVKLDIVY